VVRIGVDLVEVVRLQALVDRFGERGLLRLFTQKEITYALAARPPLCYQRLAARLAAKEAFQKAVGHSIPFGDMEVVKSEGKPYLRWRGRDHPLSLSHTARLAVAVTVVEGDLTPLGADPEGAP
jgi:holo-[acyl-carrier protein] synthase